MTRRGSGGVPLLLPPPPLPTLPYNIMCVCVLCVCVCVLSITSWSHPSNFSILPLSMLFSLSLFSCCFFPSLFACLFLWLDNLHYTHAKIRIWIGLAQTTKNILKLMTKEIGEKRPSAVGAFSLSLFLLLSLVNNLAPISLSTLFPYL